jgi:phosphatidylethanolamine/phosphatidyl-N-methylethanolamine N-methyltransferase
MFLAMADESIYQTNASMSEPATSKLYDLWAKIYDYTFGALVHKRHLRALEEVRPQPDNHVLDLGVGTGMMLEHYPRDVKVVGMDLSPGMLGKAAAKRDRLGLDHVDLVLGNALETPFADASFDRIIISHTISVVSEPNRLLREAQRLVKPDGRIIVLNHFRSHHPVIGWFERVTNPIFVKIGWRSDLTFEECIHGLPLNVMYHFKCSLIDLWQIVVLTPGRSSNLDLQVESDTSMPQHIANVPMAVEV